ncbi:MAG: TolC family protein [Desulfuromonadales bacterium]|nr:TolC family protein [Desulfuromonadales bacterium]
MLDKRIQADDTSNNRCAWLCLGLICLLLAACTPAATYQASVIQAQGVFSASGETPLPVHWWTNFEDPALDRLIAQALADNFTLQSAWDRLDQARAVARRSGADLVPQLSGEAGGSTSSSRIDSRSNSSQSFNLGLVASYEIDLWGRIRSTSEAAVLDALASEESLQTAALTLSAQVATTWYQFLEQIGQIEILEQQQHTNEQALELVSLQFRTGQVSIADLLQQRQVVESRRGERALAAARAQVLQNQLAVLLGVAPDQAPPLASSNFGELPPLPSTGLQSSLLQRRPDVRAAWLQLQAADQRVAAAVADRFPRLSLTGRVDSTSEQIEDLFDDWLASLAANLLAPLIDGGRRRAEVERSQAVAAEALHDYGQTVLEAFTEVENALTQEQRQQEYLASISRQLELSIQASWRIRDRYLNGAEDYQRVLGALLSNQLLQRTQLTARRELFVNRINLCRALAGGWKMSRQPERPIIPGE